MELNSIITQIVEVCLIPLLGILTTYLVKFIQAKADKIAADSKNELVGKYTEMLGNTISQCVLATNQTYVNSLKNQGKFDIDAQKEAFQITYEAVMAILSDEAKEYLSSAYGDLMVYINKSIEAEVNKAK